MREILFKAKRKNWRELPSEEWWVKGYIWEGADHSYMIPFTYGIDYNERTNRLIAYAVEIDPETICQITAEDIDRIPTAFDKEKVIEDLNDWREEAEKLAFRYDEIGDADNMEIQNARESAFARAIEIVKGSGSDE